jgi:hypothetical protein
MARFSAVFPSPGGLAIDPGENGGSHAAAAADGRPVPEDAADRRAGDVREEPAMTEVYGPVLTTSTFGSIVNVDIDNIDAGRQNFRTSRRRWRKDERHDIDSAHPLLAPPA